MITSAPARRAMSWSIRAYAILLHLYPPSFRREFGDSMLLVFGDLTRDVGSRAGVAGLTLLWMRTLVDLAVSLGRAYAGDRRDSWYPLATGALVLYLVAVSAVVGYGAWRYSEFYTAPAFSRFGAPAADENQLLAAYDRALAGEFGGYRSFTVAAGMSLAGLLGLTAAVFGLWQRSFVHAIGVLLVAGVLTIVALQLLPTIWFPLDRYPVSALWLIGGGLPLAAAACALILVAARYGPGRARFEHR